MNDECGSQWRKWDLHIHTPASFEWRGTEKYRDAQSKSGVQERVTEEIINALNNTDVSVYGIMDYWTFDGYFAIKDYCLTHPNVTLNKIIFPGMELRVEAPTSFRMNIHVLLSNELSDQQLHDFKHTLRLLGIDRSLSDEALIEAARKLGDDVAKNHGYGSPRDLNTNDLFLLSAKTALITRKSFEEAVEMFRDHCVVILPYSSYGGIERLNADDHPHLNDYFMQFADLIEESNAEKINLFLGVKTPNNERFIHNFTHSAGGYPKPCISGSDAHRPADYGNFPGNKITWLKADTTFDGLIRVLHEPQDRSFVGEVPPGLQRFRNNPTKHIEALTVFKNKPTSLPHEDWFDETTISFNPGLVAIIGNRGSGKSALTDILSLLGHSHRDPSDYSFLNN